MNRVVHFEILADDFERAIEFYKTVFAWKIDRWGDEKYALVTTGDEKSVGINGGIMPRMSYFEQKGAGYKAFVCTVDVENLDEIIGKVKAAGGEQVSDKKEIPGVGVHCYFKDTEGNVFGAMQS